MVSFKNKALDLSFFKKPVFMVLLIVFISIFSVYSYMGTLLQGDFNKHFLSAEMFGVPTALENKGIETLYKNKNESGWDGQFYYYISNDILGVTEAVNHIDAPSYRYQRIGLPLTANIFSKILFQDWVSPLIFYLSSLIIVVFAVYSFARHLVKNGASVYYSLFWGMAFGTLVTQINGLPDAIADAYLILAILSRIQDKKILYFIFIVFACLSREAYVVFPVTFIIWDCFRFLKGKPIKKQMCVFVSNIVTCVIFIGWQIYLKKHFGLFPYESSAGILSFPLYNAFIYMYSGLSGAHLFVPAGRSSYIEGVGGVFYLFILVTASYYATIFLVKNKRKCLYDAKIYPIYISFLILALLYSCFGHVVMMHHTGYMKAISIMIFFISFNLALFNKGRARRIITFFLVVQTIYFCMLFYNRIGRDEYFPQLSEVQYEDLKVSCLKNYDSKLQILKESEYIHESNNAISFFERNQKIFLVRVENLSNEYFNPILGFGSVNLSYKWFLKKSNKQIIEGLRTILPHRVEPGKKIEVPMRILFPNSKGEYYLRISLVQEGCAWFYDKNENSFKDIEFKL
jgi:hypothetical protein